MNVFILDITGRTSVKYDPCLCQALAGELPDAKVTLLSPEFNSNLCGYSFKKLVSLVPNNLTSSEGKVKRLLRAVELFINYIIVAIHIWSNKPDILHIQWLPILEFSKGERLILLFFKSVDNKLKMVLTLHNLYPHNSFGEKRNGYKRRFLEVDKVIDRYIVHLKSTKAEVVREFDIEPNKISIAYHGIFEAKGYVAKEKLNGNVINIIMYGYQNRYKGTDLLVQALEKLPAEYLAQTKTTIVGKTDPAIYETNISKCDGLNVEWINQYVSEEELYRKIGESDLIVLPYREISQSGVLLLALSYRKPIITSNLPSFKETLEGYADDWFFESENVESLNNLLVKFINHEIDVDKMIKVIDNLNRKYSWEETAKATKNAYEKVLCTN